MENIKRKMDSNFSFLIIICLLTVSWYYYTKYKDLERDFVDLNNNLTKITMENANYRVRIKDLQKYKNDVSKTFKILDNELVQINNHVEKNNQQSQQLLSQSLSQSLPIQLTSRLSSGLYTTGSNSNSSSRVNLLTPDMLNNLIENMNQEFSFFNPLENISNVENNQNTHSTDTTTLNNNVNTAEEEDLPITFSERLPQEVLNQNQEPSLEHSSIQENNVLNQNQELDKPVAHLTSGLDPDSVRAWTSQDKQGSCLVQSGSEHEVVDSASPSSVIQELPRILSMMNPIDTNNTDSDSVRACTRQDPGLSNGSFLRSMSFPNLPNVYGRFRIPMLNDPGLSRTEHPGLSSSEHQHSNSGSGTNE